MIRFENALISNRTSLSTILKIGYNRLNIMFKELVIFNGAVAIQMEGNNDLIKETRTKARVY